MDISVIVLTYNQQDTIAQTLDSILEQQTEADYEIIIGDDASTDLTPKICAEYAEKHPDKIRFFARQKNIGLVKNYFDCFEKSNGWLIGDCAGDDYWVDKKKLQSQFEALRDNHEVTLVSGMWLSENETDCSLSLPDNEASPGEYSGRDFLLDLFLNKKVINLSSSLYRKSIIEKAIKEFPEIIKGQDFLFEDLQIVMECASQGKILVLPTVVLHYRMGSNSISHQKSFIRRFKYTYGAMLQRHILQVHFFPDPSSQEKKKIKKFNERKGDYIMAMAFYAGPQSFDFSKLKSYHITTGLKGKIYKWVMKYKPVWKLVLKLRRF